MEQKFSFNRCVTVNFHNQTSRTLSRTSGDFTVEWGEHSVQAPPTINPGETVQWDQKSDFTQSLIFTETYSFSTADGQNGNISIYWNNSPSQSNVYSVGCSISGLFYISYTGGSGDESTIDVVFYEFAYNQSQFWNLISQEDSTVLAASDNNSVIAIPFSPSIYSDPACQWLAIDPKSGAVADQGYGGTFKIINKKYQSFLTAFMYSNNNIGLYFGNDGPDQYWYWKHHDTIDAYSLINYNCNLALLPSGNIFCAGQFSPNQWWFNPPC